MTGTETSEIYKAISALGIGTVLSVLIFLAYERVTKALLAMIQDLVAHNGAIERSIGGLDERLKDVEERLERYNHEVAVLRDTIGLLVEHDHSQRSHDHDHDNEKDE